MWLSGAVEAVFERQLFEYAQPFLLRRVRGLDSGRLKKILGIARQAADVQRDCINQRRNRGVA